MPHSRGHLLIDDTGEQIGPATTAETAQGMRAFAHANLHVAGGSGSLSVDRCVIGGRPFNTTLHFDGPRLRQVDLVMVQPADGKSWDDWTLENEMARKAAHEAWAASVFGRPLEVEPYLMPGPVYPFNPGPEHARHAAFDWGDVGSYYDSKGGSAWLRVRYGQRPPAGGS